MSESFSFNVRDVIKSELMIGPDPVKVTTIVNGKRVRIGEGRINPDTMIFTTKLDEAEDNPNAGIFWDKIKLPDGAYSIGAGLVTLAEVSIGDSDIPERVRRNREKERNAAKSADVAVNQDVNAEESNDSSEDSTSSTALDGHSPSPKFHNHD